MSLFNLKKSIFPVFCYDKEKYLFFQMASEDIFYVCPKKRYQHLKRAYFLNKNVDNSSLIKPIGNLFASKVASFKALKVMGRRLFCKI